MPRTLDQDSHGGPATKKKPELLRDGLYPKLTCFGICCISVNRVVDDIHCYRVQSEGLLVGIELVQVELHVSQSSPPRVGV